MKKFTSCIRSKANGLALRARMALSNQRGDFYISDAVKIIIAVVLGALLLAALTSSSTIRSSPGSRRRLRACSLKCPSAGISLWTSTAGPRFFIFSKNE